MNHHVDGLLQRAAHADVARWVSVSVCSALWIWLVGSLRSVSDPSPLDMLTIRGSRERRSGGAQTEVTVATPKTLTSYTSRSCAAVMSAVRTPHSTVIPALLTSTTSRPATESNFLTAASPAPASVFLFCL